MVEFDGLLFIMYWTSKTNNQTSHVTFQVRKDNKNILFGSMCSALTNQNMDIVSGFTANMYVA